MHVVKMKKRSKHLTGRTDTFTSFGEMKTAKRVGNPWFNSKCPLNALCLLYSGVEDIAEGAVTVNLDPNKDGLNAFTSFWETRKPLPNDYNPWFGKYWEEVFQCNMPNGGGSKYQKDCDPDLQKLTATGLDPAIPYIIKSVDAVAYGIDMARKNKCPGSHTLCSSFRNAPNKWGVIHSNIRRVQAPDVITFDVNTGEATDTRYSIYNYRAKYGQCSAHCYQKVSVYAITFPTKSLKIVTKMRKVMNVRILK